MAVLGEEGAHVVAVAVGGHVGVDGIDSRVEVREVGAAVVERGEKVFAASLGSAPRVWLRVETDGVIDELLGGGRRARPAPRILAIVSAAVLDTHALRPDDARDHGEAVLPGVDHLALQPSPESQRCKEEAVV